MKRKESFGNRDVLQLSTLPPNLFVFHAIVCVLYAHFHVMPILYFMVISDLILNDTSLLMMEGTVSFDKCHYSHSIL